MEIVTLRHSRCFENGNDDFGVAAFRGIHCAHWSSGFMVLNASISRVLGQRPTFYCPEVGARTYLHITVQSMYNVHTKKQNNNNNNTSGRWSHRCGNVPSLFKQIPTFSFMMVDGATVMATKLVVEIGDAASRAGLSRVGYFIPLNAAR